MNNKILLFRECAKLSVMFDKWCEENELKKYPINMIAWLQINGFLNVEEIEKKLKEENK